MSGRALAPHGQHCRVLQLPSREGKSGALGISSPEDLRLQSVCYLRGAVGTPVEQTGWAPSSAVQRRQGGVLLAWRVGAGCCGARAALQRRPALVRGTWSGEEALWAAPDSGASYGSCGQSTNAYRGRGKRLALLLGCQLVKEPHASVFASLACCCVPFNRKLCRSPQTARPLCGLMLCGDRRCMDRLEAAVSL